MTSILRRVPTVCFFLGTVALIAAIGVADPTAYAASTTGDPGGGNQETACPCGGSTGSGCSSSAGGASCSNGNPRDNNCGQGTCNALCTGTNPVCRCTCQNANSQPPSCGCF
jgi:hypothetical protein